MRLPGPAGGGLVGKVQQGDSGVRGSTGGAKARRGIASPSSSSSSS